MNNFAMNILMSFGTHFGVQWDIYLELEFLGHKVGICSA